MIEGNNGKKTCIAIVFTILEVVVLEKKRKWSSYPVGTGGHGGKIGTKRVDK